MLDPAQFAFVGKAVLKLSEPAIEENSEKDPIAPEREDHLPAGFSQPLLTAMTRLVEIVAELRSPMGGWPSDLPKTSENLIPYVLEEAYDVLDALEESPENSPENSLIKSQEARGNSQKPVDILGAGEKFIIVDELLPRLLWNVVRSSYDVMQLIGGVPAQVVRSGEAARFGLVRLVVGLAVSSNDHPWFVDLATHNACPDGCESDFCPADALIHCPDVTVCHEQISVGDLLGQLRQEMANAYPELAKFMEPKPVEWLHPNSQWLSGLLQLTMDLEFVAQAQADPQDAAEARVEKAEPELADISGSLDPDPAWLNSIVRLSQRSMLPQEAKTAIGQALIFLLPQIQQVARESVNSAWVRNSTVPMLAVDDVGSPNAINLLVSTAYELLEAWEFPWGEGEVAIDECLHRLLWQTITSSYPVMQLIGSVEAMVLIPGEDWQIGILRLLALFEIKTSNSKVTLDLSTGQPLEANRFLDQKTIVRSPNTELCRHPVTVQHLLNTLSQQIQTVTPAFKWLINGVKIDLLDAEGNWQSGSGQYRLDFEFIIV